MGIRYRCQSRTVWIAGLAEPFLHKLSFRDVNVNVKTSAVNVELGRHPQPCYWSYEPQSNAR